MLLNVVDDCSFCKFHEGAKEFETAAAAENAVRYDQYGNRSAEINFNTANASSSSADVMILRWTI